VSVRVVAGEILSKDATTRVIVPTSAVPRAPPFERVAETIATARRRLPPHRHENAEVFTYVIEGTGTYDFGPGPSLTMVRGSSYLLTAPQSITHSISPGPGQTLRYFATIVSLPPGSTLESRLQSTQPPAVPEPDGTMDRALAGPGTRVSSFAGLAAEAIEFHDAGTAFRKVGHDRLAIAYAAAGTGKVDNQALEAGEAALVEDAAGVAIAGRPGLKVILTSVPRSSPVPG
jgi:redox-sensitive bicupin YhaK (pirin superfamily)